MVVKAVSHDCSASVDAQGMTQTSIAGFRESEYHFRNCCTFDLKTLGSLLILHLTFSDFLMNYLYDLQQLYQSKSILIFVTFAATSVVLAIVFDKI